MIKIINLDKEYNEIQEEIQLAINKVLEKQWFILGDELKKFEGEFSKYIGAKYGIGVNSGSDALYLAILGCGIGEGDEVITVSHTFISTVDAISRSGAKPVFVDIEPNTFNIDTTKIKGKITNKTKAIIPVHLYGNPANMDPIIEIANQYGLYVIEDACQAHGAEYKRQKVGSIGHIGCFSFYPAKNLGAYGDGGMIITNDKELANKLLLFRNYGQSKKYYHDFVGINSRLDEIQAAVIRVKLKYLDEWNKRRRKVANLYNEILEGSHVQTPIEQKYSKHVFHLYVIKSKNRDSLKAYLENNNIQTLIHYPIPVHQQKAYLDYKENFKLPITEKICNKILSLPMHPWLIKDDINLISQIIKKFEIR